MFFHLHRQGLTVISSSPPLRVSSPSRRACGRNVFASSRLPNMFHQFQTSCDVRISNIHIYIYIYICIYIHIYIHLYSYMYIYICIFNIKNMFVYVYWRITIIYINIGITCANANMYVYIHIYIYIMIMIIYICYVYNIHHTRWLRGTRSCRHCHRGSPQ